MGGNKKWTRRAAVGSLASGGGLLLFGTGGSTQITSYRDVEVNAGDGDDAVLQFVDRSEDADVVEPGSPAVVYEIRDNVGAFAAENIAVDARVVDGGAIGATVSTESSPFEVAVSCDDGASELSGSYAVALEFTASNSEFTITASRTTESPIEVDCGLDYSNGANYRDGGNDTDIPPRTDAKGSVESPGNANSEDGSYATLKSESNKGGGPKGGKIGFTLPPVSVADAYELEVAVSGTAPSGDWVVYLVDEAGTRLTSTGNGDKDKLQSSTNSFTFDSTESDAIRSNRRGLYLVFETTSNGNEVTAAIDYFELKPTQNSTS